ncbi:Nucleotidyltransferase [Xylaria sp. CBS 124048]|nr:Nucleotidyltransferase [Xylaria sp. CBS 124048]
MVANLVFPTIFLLPTHFDADELPKLEGQIPTLTYDINEAEIILGKVAKKPRAILELRLRGLPTQEINDTAGEEADAAAKAQSPREATQDTHETADRIEMASNSVVKVVRLAWFTDSLVKRKVLPVDDYLVYRGQKKLSTLMRPARTVHNVLKHAREDDGNGHGRPASQDRSYYAHVTHHPRSTLHAKPPRLASDSTSEHERAVKIPPMPDYIHTPYSCQRPTPSNSPNSDFIEEIKKIRTLRILESDEVGVRAYSTGIAILSAYPYPFTSAAEIARLRGCGPKIVELYRQWKANGYLDDVREAASDPRIQVLLLFYDIWGVGAKTANEFYNRGWRDLDDIVEHGWDKLTRAQQVGVKYYDELKTKIPRVEVESIASIILEHANRVRNGFHQTIVGGYRRGKTASGDVDVVLSHPEPSATEYVVNEIVTSLEKSGYVTHTLTLSNKNSERGQIPVSWKGNDRSGSGFDTLDKALLVWQDPNWDTTKASKNPNPHRRVDIIISPWQTVGCAIVGWTGATTFERDLRRYCKKEMHLKFDSSGVRMREAEGQWVPLENDADGNPAADMLTAEKRVFERLGLKWLQPEERCTS